MAAPAHYLAVEAQRTAIAYTNVEIARLVTMIKALQRRVSYLEKRTT